MNEKVLHFPDRSLLKLIDGVNGLLRGKIEPADVLAACDEAMLAIGAVKNEKGEWELPPSSESDG